MRLLPSLVLLVCLGLSVDARATHHEYPHSLDFPSRFNMSVLRYRPRKCPGYRQGGQQMYFCPTPKPNDYVDWPCIRYADLCNGATDCPQGEDEHPTLCMFHNLFDGEMTTMRKNIHDLLLGTVFKNEKELPIRDELVEDLE